MVSVLGPPRSQLLFPGVTRHFLLYGAGQPCSVVGSVTLWKCDRSEGVSADTQGSTGDPAVWVSLLFFGFRST